MPKEKPKVAIGEVIKSYRTDRGLSQGDIERRTGLLRCYLSRVENGHTVPSLETLAKIAEALEISLAEFFPSSASPQDREKKKMLGEMSEDEIRFLGEIKRYSSTLSDGDKKLVLDLIRFAEFAHRSGERGMMKHVSCFFKAPYLAEENGFFRQHEALLAYAAARKGRRGGAQAAEARLLGTAGVAKASAWRVSVMRS